MRQLTFGDLECSDIPPDPEDPDWLRHAYNEEDMTLSEMADEAGVGYGKIHNWMERHGIERRTSAESRNVRGTNTDPRPEGGVHRDPEWLSEKYYDEGLTMEEMADEAGLKSGVTIMRWMDRHGVDRRPSYVTRVMRNPGAGFVHADHAGGYETIRHSVDDHTYNFKLHRLLAMAVYGIGEVKEKMVHHKNGIPWDNRPDNIELLNDQAEHATRHEWGANL